MNRIFKRTLLPVTLSAMLGMASGQTPNTTTNGASAGAANQTINTPGSKDALIQAIEMNNAEVTLAKMATTKAQDAKVKAFATMMVSDHTQALMRLRDVQGGTTVDVMPNAKHQATVNALSKLSGAQFDREFMAAMIADHDEALDFLEKQSKMTDPPTSGTSLSKFSQEMVPSVRQHLQEAQNIQKGMSNSAEPRSSNTNQIINTGQNGKNANTTSGKTEVPGNGNDRNRNGNAPATNQNSGTANTPGSSPK